MGEVVYTAEIPLTRVKGPLRLARMPTESEPVRFGTHGAIARHYGIQGTCRIPTQRPLITSSLRQVADCSEPLGARWRRATSRQAEIG